MMSPQRLLSFLALIFLLLPTGCGNSYVERPTQIHIDPDGDFWALPLPSDWRVESDGSMGLESWPEANDFAKLWFRAVESEGRGGWGLTTGIFVKATGCIDPETLPQTAADSLGSLASVFLVDIDPDSPQRGERLPVEVSIPPVDRYTPENLIAAVPAPGFLRRPGTTYALVLTDDLLDCQGERVGRTRVFHESLVDSSDAHPRMREDLGLLRSVLVDEGYDLGRVAGVSPVTGYDPMVRLGALTAWTESLPAPDVAGPWVTAQTYPDYQILQGTFEVPVIQRDVRPYGGEDEGLIAWEDETTPSIIDHQTVRLALAIPRQPQPEAGFPLTLYLHGSGGEWYQPINRGPRPEIENPPDPEPGTGPAAWLARKGIATLGFDFPMHGNRHQPPDTTGLTFYNLTTNPRGTIHSFHAAVMELLILSRLVTTTSIDGALSPNLDPGGAADGAIRFDPARLTAFGQSMGSTLGAPWAAVDPRVKGIVFSGAGGLLSEIAAHSEEPVDVNGVVGLFAGLDASTRLHSAHPLVHTMQNLWDHIEPSLKNRHVLTSPLPGRQPKDVLMLAGFRDGYFHPRAQAAMAGSLGIGLVGEAAEPFIASSLELAGIDAASYPATAGTNGAVSGVISLAAPLQLGHYIAFNRAPLQYQIGCFLQSVGSSQGGWIVAPAEDEAAPCPER